MTAPAVEPIETARLTLEPLTPDHAAEMVTVLADPDLYTFTGGDPPTLDELRARYRRLVAGPPAGRGGDWLNWVARRRDDRRLVGTVQATVTAGTAGRQAAIAWVVGVPWQRRGFATEAAAALVGWLRDRGIAAVTADIHPDHRGSQAVARHAGLAPTDQVVDGEVVWRRLLRGQNV